jgi:serine phosphatase RsbU (regulator of sigma subunit)
MEPQMVLGVDPKETYETAEFDLPTGANIVLYTDGALDVESPSGKRFGSDGLKRTLFGKFASAQAVIDKLLVSVDEFRGHKALPDDLTLVAIQLVPTPSRRTPVAAGT